MTALLTTLAATCIILNRADQIARVSIIRNPESTQAQVHQATHDLVSSNVRLAHKVAKQHVRNGVTFDDLLAQACEGIVYAAGKYEVGSRASFTTYAQQWMRAKCPEHVQANAGLLHCGSPTPKKPWASLQKAQKALQVLMAAMAPLTVVTISDNEVGPSSSLSLAIPSFALICKM